MYCPAAPLAVRDVLEAWQWITLSSRSSRAIPPCSPWPLWITAFPGDSDAERGALRSALEAAAVPHWCDAAVLTALIDDSGLLGPGQWARLKVLPVIEPCPEQGADAGRVAEASRLTIRKRLAATDGRGSSS